MAKKQYKVMAYVSYGKPYCVGTFGTKTEAKSCLARQYQTPSRSFCIEEV